MKKLRVLVFCVLVITTNSTPIAFGESVDQLLNKKVVDEQHAGKPLFLAKAPSKINAIVKAKSELYDLPPGMADLNLSDHLEDVPLKANGDTNDRYMKEIFFGEAYDLDMKSDKDKLKQVKKTFTLVDFNMDKKMSLDELEAWISITINEHMQEAEKSNHLIFKLLDTDGNGALTWSELQKRYLRLALRSDQTMDVPDSLSKSFFSNPHEKSNFFRLRNRFEMADMANTDGELSDMEFLWFRHPEQSAVQRKKIATDMILQLDIDADGKLSEEEFVTKLDKADEENEEDEADDLKTQVDPRAVEKRRLEFKQSLDLDGDGHADVEELMNFLNPYNKVHAKREASYLISQADENNDGGLSLQETVDHIDLILGSKLIGTNHKFRDEF